MNTIVLMTSEIQNAPRSSARIQHGTVSSASQKRLTSHCARPLGPLMANRRLLAVLVIKTKIELKEGNIIDKSKLVRQRNQVQQKQ